MWTQRCNTKAFYLCEGPKDTLEYELLGIVDPGQSVKQQTKEDLIPLAFDAAKSSCVARGGQLAQIRNHAEFGKVESLLGSYNLTGSAYFGASDITKEGSWVTVDGFSMQKYGSYFPDHTEVKGKKEITIKNKLPNDNHTVAEIKRQETIETERIRRVAAEKERARLAKLAAEKRAREVAAMIAKAKAEAAR